MSRYDYPLEFTPDDNGTLLVTCASLPEVTSYGETEAEALENGQRAVEEAIAARLAHFQEIPAPAIDAKARHWAKAPLRLQPKIALMDAMMTRRWTRADLVRATGWPRNSVDRLFNPHHNSRLEQFEQAFTAVGVAPTFVAEQVRRAG